MFAKVIGPLMLATSLAGLIWSSPAAAQRVDDNAIADAEDAFGSNDGGEDLGLYSPFDVRGFSPIDAGNVRIDGVYFDRQGDLSPRLVEGNRIRVGASAFASAFPAPSGIVDYRLRTPGDAAALSVVSQLNSFGGALVEIDGALPLLEDSLSIGGGVSYSRSEYASGNNADVFNVAAIAHWQAPGGGDLKAFWSRTRIGDEDIYPIVIGEGEQTPQRLKRRRFLGQHWADVETERFNYGLIARTTLGGFGLRVGAFRSVNDVSEAHNVFLYASDLGAPAARSVTSYPGRSARSSSAELAIVRSFGGAEVHHRLQFVMRGRAQDRRYGGTDRIDLRPAPFGEPDYVERPSFAFGAQSFEEVRQWSAGLDYRLSFGERGHISAGVQRVDYEKHVTAPAGPAPSSIDSFLLFNAGATFALTPDVSLYGSITRGLEESEVAPQTAINRDEAPPALETEQIDAGLRVRLGDMTLIAGAFDIARPYYGVDVADFFRELGNVRHRGFEASLSGSPLPGLTIVVGGALVQARLSGEEVASGTIGPRPIDVPSSRAVASFDWRAPSSPTSFDLTAEYVGANTGDSLNLVRVDPYATIDIGLRHRFRIGDASAVLRLQAKNLFNEYGWEVAGNNAFVYIQSRQLLARLTVDF